MHLADELQRRLGDRELIQLSLGYSGLEFFAPEQLDLGQVGYAVSDAGADLTGTGDGDWRAEWLVLGYDESLGDPFFADTSDPAWPVYTAMHGEARWDPMPVADSFESFLGTIAIIRRLALERSSPVALEETPLSPSDVSTALASIAAENPRVGASYWMSWFD